MGEIQTRENGSLVCHETGQVHARGRSLQLWKAPCCSFTNIAHVALPAHWLDVGHPTSLPVQVTAYAIDSVQQRGRLFVSPGDQVYEGQVIGIYQRQGDLKVGGRDGQGHGVGWRCGSLDLVHNGMQ